jgi:hypothetical protein
LHSLLQMLNVKSFPVRYLCTHTITGNISDVVVPRSELS